MYKKGETHCFSGIITLITSVNVPNNLCLEKVKVKKEAKRTNL